MQYFLAIYNVINTLIENTYCVIYKSKVDVIYMKFKSSIQKQILSILLDTREPITMVKLAEMVSLSEKTVRNYLKDIEDDMKSNGIELIKKPNVGVFVNVDEEKRAQLERNIKNSRDEIVEFSPEARRGYILDILLKTRDTYTIQLLSDDLYCSKSTIINDLVFVEKWLKDHELELKRKQNQGLWVEGNEENFRKAMSDLFYEIREESYETQVDENELDQRIDIINYKKIKMMFPRVDLLKIQKIIQEAEDKLEYSFTDQAFVNFIVHIAIVIERIKNNKSIEVEEETASFSEENADEYRVAEWIVERIGKEFKLDIPKNEVYYVSLHILGARIQEQVEFEDIDSLLKSQDEVYLSMARDMISLVGDILKVDFSNDKLLLLALTIHLRPTTVKLKYGLNLRNPILDRIKKEYTSIFGASWACSSIFERYMNLTINEDEIGYIALHFAVALDRAASRIKAVIVCSSGIGTSQMVAARIRKKFGELEIISIVPVKKLDERLILQADVIISTIPIQKSDANAVYISTLVDEVDVLKIRKVIDNIKTHRSCIQEVQKPKSWERDGIIDEELCFVEENRYEFTEIIKYYSGLMERMGYVKPGFSENILERENKSSTYIGKGVAIPHSQEEFVIVPKICIISLKKPVYWHGNELKIIIILALRFKDITTTKSFFKNFYNVLDNDKAIKMLWNAVDGREISKIFINGGDRSE